jgi:hypothetical protein
MITPPELAYIAEHAYVPEHLPHYVTAISRTEPFLIGDFVVYIIGDHLIFVGYPLDGNFDDARMLQTLGEAKKRFEPDIVSILAPEISGELKDCLQSQPDSYYRLDLSQLVIPNKTGNMLRRAGRDIIVSVGKFRWGHKRLFRNFMKTRSLDDATRFIFERVSKYARCDNVAVLDARNKRGDLVAFDIMDYSAQHYAFYMFNCRSRKYNIPGASDLLLAHAIERAQEQGKRYLNLGLGIDEGITFFKKKWGAARFLKCVSCVQESRIEQSAVGMFVPPS